MKPTVIANANATANAGAAAAGGGGNGNAAGMHIPINMNRDYTDTAHGLPQQHPGQVYHQQQPYASDGAYGSPRSQQQPQPQPQPHQQLPQHQQQQPQYFQAPFGFEPDMDIDMDNMFQRSRLGRLHHDPFAGFGGTRKRNSLHDPHHTHSMHADDDFSLFNDAADFGFPQFSTMGRRGRVAGGGGNSHLPDAVDDDFFNRLPSEFRQYIPENFGARRTGAAPTQPHHHNIQHEPQQQPQFFIPPQQPAPQSPSKRLCDAAIQTEDTVGQSEVDCAPTTRNDTLNQHGLRNTMDMGIKNVAEQEQAARSHSAPPTEQQQQQQQQQRPTPAPQQQFGTQTSPPVQSNYAGQPTPPPPHFHKAYYAPQQQAHPQQKQQTPPPAPQTPNGTYVRTIPIFVEGRSEPIINAHKEIPNQYAAPSAGAQAQAAATARAYAPAQPQQRPTPLNTQQQQQQLPQAEGVLPPQTPHTLDSINKIQDIQRDVLELMAKVEQFKGTRQEKEYAYLDEMLTRNLLKLDTIDTNGKDSIRLARKEAIKCIQASINVLEAKAGENARSASGAEQAQGEPPAQVAAGVEAAAETSASLEPTTPEPADATQLQEPIPLPAPPGAVAPPVETEAVSAEAAQPSEPAAVQTSTLSESAK